MRLLVAPHQPGRVHIRIALRRRDRHMPEELLDSPQIGTGAQQMPGEAVAQGVRSCRFGQPKIQTLALHRPLH
jgi:hypothetical protein